MISEISLFFEPLSTNALDEPLKGTLAERIEYFTPDRFPDITKGTVAILSVPEFRGDEDVVYNSGNHEGIRLELANLKDNFSSLRIVDLGVIRPGETVKDTYYAVSAAVAAIIKEGAIAVILGGSDDLTYANYLAYEKLEQVVNLVSVDPRFDIGEAEDEVSANKYLQKIILHQPNILFNFSNLAYQSHHVPTSEVNLMKKMYFDVYRLGELQHNLEQVEPVVRSADLLSFDLSAVRSSDLPDNLLQEPNGLYGEQACAIARYSGLSDKLSSFGVFNVPLEASDRSNKLIAQILWYFLLGVNNRKGDYPFADKDTYTKYTVSIEDGTYDIVFYKSHLSDRWWMEVPYPSKRGSKYQRHFMVPCHYEDYQTACKDEIPDRWWQTFQKLG
ncbi:MAG: formimidoylglutamase [Flavobacteriales bacterium]|nr:formimidoylglutamase [Flavobacteriales bacterium]MCB9204769.1 formimidoylglutamase [Flavobacteriales bacterium]